MFTACVTLMYNVCHCLSNQTQIKPMKGKKEKRLNSSELFCEHNLDVNLSVHNPSCRLHLSLVVRTPAFCICENKDADHLRSNCAADQCLCIHYIDTTSLLLSKSEISSL